MSARPRESHPLVKEIAVGATRLQSQQGFFDCLRAFRYGRVSMKSTGTEFVTSHRLGSKASLFFGAHALVVAVCFLLSAVLATDVIAAKIASIAYIRARMR